MTVTDCPAYQLSDSSWAHTKPLLFPPQRKAKPSRLRMDDRRAMTAMYYALRTGLPMESPAAHSESRSTVHGRFQEWRPVRVFECLRQAGLTEIGIDLASGLACSVPL